GGCRGTPSSLDISGIYGSIFDPEAPGICYHGEPYCWCTREGLTCGDSIFFIVRIYVTAGGTSRTPSMSFYQCIWDSQAHHFCRDGDTVTAFLPSGTTAIGGILEATFTPDRVFGRRRYFENPDCYETFSIPKLSP